MRHHLPAWKRFYQKAKAGGAVGVWHETYMVGQGQNESVYVYMPRFGLGSVMEHISAGGRQGAACERLMDEPQAR